MNMPRTYWSIRLMMGLILTLSLALDQTTPAFAAQRCYVKAGAAGSGGSWANAYGNPQAALANAACTEIWVAKGTYKPTAGTNRGISFQLKNGVAIYGGFAGTEASSSARDWVANVTILSGNIGNPVVRTDNTWHVVRAEATNSTAILDGLTITGGYAENGLGGGGMWNNGSSPSLRNLIFSGNLATFGGGMYNENTSGPSLVNVTFTGNTTDRSDLGGGAGIYNYTNSSPSLLNVTFIGNSAAPSGGALQNDQGGNATLVNVAFIGNAAGTYGGGICNINSSPSLTNVTFRGNSAGIAGGAVCNFSSSPSFTNVTLSGNPAPSGGGIWNANASLPTVRNSILYGDSGGEITNTDTSNTIVTFSIVQGGYPGAGNLNANPRLLPLGNYGGSTKTMPLGYGSPAIDHGTNTGCPLSDQRGVSRPKDGDGNTTLICDMGATESQGLAGKSFLSAAAQDGWVLESSETSGIGGDVHSTDTTLIVGDSTDKRQARGILSFNTASLPDTAQLVSVVLKVRQAAISKKSPFSELGSLLVDVRKGPFSNNAALQAADFQASASKPAAMAILNNPTASGWYSRAVPATSFKYINKLGLTQFRLRFSLDDNNDAVSNYIRFYSGNAPTASDRPVLAVKYYMP